MNTKKHQLLIIAGTYDGREFIKILKNYNISILATVATQRGKELLVDTNVDIIAGRLNEDGFKELMTSQSINCVLDASHPYAYEVTDTVSKVCSRFDIPYVRYLRPSENKTENNVISMLDTETTAIYLSKTDGNILLTTGSKDLNVFVEKMGDYRQRLFVRILPASESIEKCEKLGIPMSNIIAMCGHFSKDMNKEIIKYCKASILVTKDSGKVGGFEEKIAAAHELGTKVIVIQRHLENTIAVSTYETAIDIVIKKIMEREGELVNA